MPLFRLFVSHSWQATLLLPLEQHPAGEPITAEFIKDHIALCDGLSRNHAPVFTLSGLRGVLVEYVRLELTGSISSMIEFLGKI